MKVLHTSDWHLGRTLYGKKRHAEHEAFLTWLIQTMQEHDVDVLLLAGDVFDTTTPGNQAQELYYGFLAQVAQTACRHVVIIAGNHDSAAFLSAPQSLLKALNIHVVASVTARLEDQLLILSGPDGSPELIVCAVPYLRDRDLRSSQPGETVQDKEQKLLAAIRAHYAAMAGLATHQRQALGLDIPIIAMGHLFTAGGHTVDGDGVRDLYVGSLAHVAGNIFDAAFDYVALGHLHVPQQVAGQARIRYSGSVIPMGFGEAGQQKSVCLLHFTGRELHSELLPIPQWQKLLRIQGDWQAISTSLQQLRRANVSVWIELIYTGADLIGDLRARVDALVRESRLEVLRIQDRPLLQRTLSRLTAHEQLGHLSPLEVFQRCLLANEIPAAQRSALLLSYQEILQAIEQADQP